MSKEELQKKLAALEERYEQLEAKKEQLEAKNERLQTENDRLNEKVDRLEHQLSVVNKLSFGPRSEKTEYIADGQLSMFNEAEKESDGKDPAKEKKTVVKEHTRKPKRTRERSSVSLCF